MSDPCARVVAMLPDAQPNGNGWRACCPAHDDQQPSLSIREGDDGRVLLHCFAGCSTEAVCESLGLKMTDLMPQSKPGDIVATYDYRDESGNLLFQVVRREPKRFQQRRPDSKGGWQWSIKGVRVVPYRLPELLAKSDETVFVVEGERDADNLARLGLLATCNSGGAGKWKAEHAEFLQGRRVVILPDNDEPGRKHARQVAESLAGIAESVRIVELPGLPVKGDASDWLANGGTREQLERLAAAASEWQPETRVWSEIDSLDERDLPDFPVESLPEVLRQWVQAESHATQTPLDLAALLSLAVCSACISRRVVVEPRPGWREPVNLYVAVLLEPGNRKSAVFADAIRPLREKEAELITDARPTVARAQSDRRQDEAKLQRLEKLASKDDCHARHEALELAAELAERADPVLPRLIVDDATAEKLGVMLAEQGGRIASMSAEGGVFDLMAGLYSKNGIPQFNVYLMGHSGDTLVTDRISRKSVCVERPALTCAYAMQPQVIQGIADNPAFRGRGLLARFLYAAPRSWIGDREIAPAAVPGSLHAEYHRIVKELCETGEEIVLKLTDDADEALRKWETEIESMLGDGAQMETMRDWGAKLAGATLRLAAVLHCIEYSPTTIRIDGLTMTAAVEIARYLIPHAETALNLMMAGHKSVTSDAQYVLRWIKRHGKTEFSKSESQQHGKRRFPEADDIDDALAVLQDRGYIRLKPVATAGPGRPASPVFEVNPAVFTSRNRPKRSGNSKNSIRDQSRSDLQNIQSAYQQSEIQSESNGGEIEVVL